VALVELFSKGVSNPLGLLGVKILVLVIELTMFTILAYGLFRLDSTMRIYSRKIASKFLRTNGANNSVLKSVSQKKVEDH
ncbi:MAG: hypothetical protein ACFFCZ_28570, partial [Promethearchaeota archaeon]